MSAIKLSGSINNEFLSSPTLDDDGAHDDKKTTIEVNRSLLLNSFI